MSAPFYIPLHQYPLNLKSDLNLVLKTASHISLNGLKVTMCYVQTIAHLRRCWQKILSARKMYMYIRTNAIAYAINGHNKFVKTANKSMVGACVCVCVSCGVPTADRFMSCA